MLNQVLQEFEQAKGPITLADLSRKLEIAPDALEGMLQFWVRKGRIRCDDDIESGESVTGTCGPSCSGTTNCTFIAKMPKTYSIPLVDAKRKHSKNR
jgi:hypothetical protein